MGPSHRQFAALVLSAFLSSVAMAQVPEAGVALQGTNLRYYPRPTLAQCHADCAATPQCRGSTWIQAGTYNPNDAAMCYLMSAVTGRSPARGHFSVVRPPAPPVSPPPGRPADPNALDPSDLGNL